MTDNIKQTCCFTGHRPEKLPYSGIEVKRKLETAINDAIRDGYKNFIVGMCRGVDLWAGEIVVEKKLKNPEIRLIAAIPYPGFENRWHETDRNLYHYVLDNADTAKIVSNEYSRACYQRRNEWMCDRASRLISAYSGIAGGTRNTVNYAKRNGLDIINIFESNQICARKRRI